VPGHPATPRRPVRTAPTGNQVAPDASVVTRTLPTCLADSAHEDLTEALLVEEKHRGVGMLVSKYGPAGSVFLATTGRPPCPARRSANQTAKDLRPRPPTRKSTLNRPSRFSVTASLSDGLVITQANTSPRSTFVCAFATSAQANRSHHASGLFVIRWLATRHRQIDAWKGDACETVLLFWAGLGLFKPSELELCPEPMAPVLRLLMMRRRRAPDCRASWMAPRAEAQRRAGPGGPASESLGAGDSEFTSSRQSRHCPHAGPRVPTLTARRKVHHRASFQTEVLQVTPGPTDVL
jgi:hypothetical protein